MRSHLERNVAHCVANMLRVMRGAGRWSQVIGDLEAIAEDTLPTIGNMHARDGAAIEISRALESWGRGRKALEVDTFDEQTVCAAALRMVAARLDNNSTEYSKAWSDMQSAVFDSSRRREKRLEQQEIADFEKALALADRWEAVTKKVNDRVLAAANDNAECFVYFITDGSAIKIGKATNVRSRLSGLQTSHHKHLRVIATMPGDGALERQLHGRFRQHKIRGEWFRDCAPIRDFISNLARAA